MLNNFNLFSGDLTNLPTTNLLITTLNAHSYNVSQSDIAFENALKKSDILLPDGISVVWAKKYLSKHADAARLKKIAGQDLFSFEMERVNKLRGKVFFLGSTDKVLDAIRGKAQTEYPDLEVYTYSPPYKPEFSEADTLSIISAINEVKPDVLFVGMTAPKQEKFAYQLMRNDEIKLSNCHVCCIGAVFDFYAGTVRRAPKWVINIGLEWLYRLVSEPKRLWKRYLIGNTKFIIYVIIEKILNYLSGNARIPEFYKSQNA